MSDLKKRLLPMERLEMPELWADIERRRPGFPPDEPDPRWRRVAIAIAALAIAVGAVALAVNALSERADRLGNSPEVTTPLARNGVIAYAGSGREGIFWTVSSDGQHRTEVRVNVPGHVGLPTWSPDGTRITFDVQSNDGSQSKGGNNDIYVADADGSDPVRLTTDHAARSPAWSPDGTKIAYMRQSSGSEIWVMNLDGSDAHRLVAGRDGYFPSWSPDGSRLVFVSMDGTDANIYVVNEDGSDVRRLTDDPAHEDRPAWSPNGGTIAYTSEGGSGESGIYTIGTDGTDVSQLLSDDDPANLGFAWSPDGTSMAVVRVSGPRFERTLYVLDLATHELTAIADPGDYFGPSWQPVPPGSDPVTPSDVGPVAVPDVIGLPFDEARQVIEGAALVPDLLRGDSSAAGAVVVEQNPWPGTEVDAGFAVMLALSAPGEGSKQAVAINGVPFPVCRPVTIDGDFGGGMDRAWVFEEERVPDAGCVGEGFQRLGVGSGERVDVLSDRITDITTDRAYKVWPYATPDLDGDGVDEIALVKGEAPGSRLIWFVRVVGEDLLPIVRDCASGCEPAWNATIGAIGHQNGVTTPAGMYCEPRETGGVVLVEWAADAEDALLVSETEWTLRGQSVQAVGRRSYSVADTDGYPPSGLDELCGSTVSLPGVPTPP